MALIGTILSYLFWVILALTILVFVHELGHFLTAKWFKMRVERFSIGFPPKIASVKYGETEYCISATPLGGYVKISGMVDENFDTGFVNTPPQPHEFRAKPVWQRIIVISAGVIFNILLAIAIFIGLRYTIGDTYIPAANVEQVYVAEGSIAHEMGLRTGDHIVAVNGKRIERYDEIYNISALVADQMELTVQRGGAEFTFAGPEDLISRLSEAREKQEADPAYGVTSVASIMGQFGVSELPSLLGIVEAGSAAATHGLKEGDRITHINNTPVRFWDQLTAAVRASNGQSLDLRWQRDGRQMAAAIMPRPVADYRGYKLGVAPASGALLLHELGVEHREYGFFEAIVVGTADTWENTAATVQNLRKVVTGKEDVSKSVGGPIAIAQIAKQAGESGWDQFWYIVAMLSITLAFVNILPIPALDGGHLMFLIYEGITRREPSLRLRLALQQIGMVFLLCLMVFLIFNDVLRF